MGVEKRGGPRDLRRSEGQFAVTVTRKSAYQRTNACKNQGKDGTPMPQHSTRPDRPQTWDHPSNGEDPRQLPLPFGGTISTTRGTETATSGESKRLETDLKSGVESVQRPKRLRTAARHRWEGHRCRQCGMTREGRPDRFFKHSRFITADGEILRAPGDCPGNPR